MKKIIFFIFVLPVSLLTLFIIFAFLWWAVLEERFPPDSVQVCRELNGKKFNFENINKLNGYCYVNVGQGVATGVEFCSEKHVNEILRIYQACESEKKDNGRFFDCSYEFAKKNNLRTKFYFVGFNINLSNTIDSTWKCEIGEIWPVMKTKPWYYRD